MDRGVQLARQVEEPDLNHQEPLPNQNGGLNREVLGSRYRVRSVSFIHLYTLFTLLGEE